jgi:hypothetical protein
MAGVQERDLELQSPAAHKPTGRGQPQLGERDAQAGKGQFDLPQVLSSAMTGLIDQPIACRSAGLAH